MGRDGERQGYSFGTFQGVFTPSILTIIGVVMYLRFGWMLGNVGLPASMAIVTIGSSITLLTGLSISSLATNMRMRGGGAYYMLSRSLGLEAGAAMGIPLALAQAIGVSFYVAGFAEALVNSNLPVVGGWDVRWVGLATLAILAAVATVSADIALKLQYFIMAAIVASLVSFFLGSAPAPEAVERAAASAPPGFWPVFAVFFPAVTGILSGLGMSGDLKNPAKSIPLGTIAAVLTGYAVYMAVPLALDWFVEDAAALRADMMIVQKCARWPALILLGVWAATLSSAVGSFLCAPRVLQALANDRLLPRAFARGHGRSNDPRFGSLVCFALAAAGIWLGDINVIAPVLTMFNLITYGLLNLSAGMEETMGNPSWRPTFRVKPWLSFLGFAGCVAVMFMISPGWTFIAIACVSSIYWAVKRRALRAHWGDMRTGLLMFLVRFAFGRLARMADRDARNWRPNLLVLTSIPIRYRKMVDLAQAVSGNKSLATIATVIRGDAWSGPRAESLQNSLLRFTRRLGMECQVHVHASTDTWTGISELVRTYGYGPVVPNTFLLGGPTREDQLAPFGEFMCLASKRRRNVAVVCGRSDAADAEASRDGRGRRIDVWWRGQNANGGFMLALACLIVRSESWRGATLRLCTIAEDENRTGDALRTLRRFLASARVAAETKVVVSDGRPFSEYINAGSADAEMTLVGLRTPAPGEAPSAYGSYFNFLRENLRDVPFAVFALAQEDVDFLRIFKG